MPHGAPQIVSGHLVAARGPQRRHYRRFACRAALALALSPAIAASQSPTPASLLDRVRALGLASSTDRITVFHDRGHEAKALRLRAMVQDALQFFTDSLGATPHLTLAVVERATWERMAVGQPYGIPGVDGTPPVAFIPATDDGLAAEDALSIEAGISDSARRLVAAAGMDWPTASRRYVDLVGLHEMGHAFAESYGIRTRTRWFGEFLATYFAWSYLQAARPREASLWSGILQGYRDAVHPSHRTLADFERLYFGVGAQNYVWYQARFQQQVAAVHARYGVGFLRAARRAFPPDAKPPRSLDELTARLEAVAPGFAPWAEGMR
jgi:hypothetical protein